MGVVTARRVFPEGLPAFDIHAFSFRMGDSFIAHIILPFVSSVEHVRLLQLAAWSGH
jgi:hypothetical protein